MNQWLARLFLLAPFAGQGSRLVPEFPLKLHRGACNCAHAGRRLSMSGGKQGLQSCQILFFETLESCIDHPGCEVPIAASYLSIQKLGPMDRCACSCCSNALHLFVWSLARLDMFQLLNYMLAMVVEHQWPDCHCSPLKT